MSCVTMNSGGAQGGTLPLVEAFYTLQGEGFWTGSAAWFVRLAGCDVGCAWCDSRESWDARAFSRVSVDEIINRLPQEIFFSTPIVVVTGGEPLMHSLDGLCEKLREKGCRLHLETSGSHPFSGEWDWVCLSPKRRKPPLDEAWARADELKVVIEGPEDLGWAEECARRVEEAVNGGSRRTGVETNAKIRSWRERQATVGLKAPAVADGLSCQTRVACEGSVRPNGVAERQNRLFCIGENNVTGGAEQNGFVLFLQPEWSRREEMMPLIVEYIKEHPWWRASLQTHKYVSIP